MPYPEAAQRKGGEASKKHGFYSIRARGEEAHDSDQRTTLREIERTQGSSPAEVAAMGYQELREALRQPGAREEVKLELMTRLTVMMRIGFSEMERMVKEGRDPFGAPVVGRLGTYLNLLARLLNSYPQTKSDSLAEEIKAIRILIQDAEETIVREELEHQPASHEESGGVVMEPDD